MKDQIEDIKRKMGTKYLGHLDYNPAATPWHSTRHRTSHHLDKVRAEAIKAGRL